MCNNNNVENVLINFRPENIRRRTSLGHSPSYNIAAACSPADVTLTEDEGHTMFTLKQLKRMISTYLIMQIYLDRHFDVCLMTNTRIYEDASSYNKNFFSI